MAEIAGGDAVAEFLGRDADQKIGEWKAHAFGLILTVDLPNAKSDHHRDRMNGQGRKQFMDELVPLFLSLRCVGTGRTVGQFDQCDDGDGDVGISGCAADCGEYLPCVLPCRSAVISTLESRISPMRAVRAVRDGSRWLPRHPWRSQHP